MGTEVRHKINAVRLPARILNEQKTEALATWEPGDGTRYGIWARKVDYINGFGCLGSVAGGWMIVCSLNGHAYLFQASGKLETAYVAEHLGLDHYVSAKAITALIGFTTERETDVEVRIEKKSTPGQGEDEDGN